jgi:hypothetical protein
MLYSFFSITASAMLWLVCKIIGHKRQYWSMEEVFAARLEDHHVVGGIARPWVCRRCGFQSTILYWPEPPPMKGKVKRAEAKSELKGERRT